MQSIDIKPETSSATCTHWLVAALMMLSVGCGGISQDDMKQMAMSRAPDPEDDETTAPNAPLPPRPGTVTPTPSSPTPATSTPSPTTVNSKSSSAEATPAVRAPATTTNTGPTLPATPLNAVQRAERSAANIEKVAAGVRAYRDQHGLWPQQAIYDRAGNAVLSWRVAILPYLGYQSLYEQFDLGKPWYDPANKKLLAQIPEVYVSPERFDTKTNYLLVTGSSSIFQLPRSLHPRRIEDGEENTAIVVEVNDEIAKEWTAPEEFDFNFDNPAGGLGALRGGEFYVGWGNGAVGAVSARASIDNLRAMFTADRGESFTMASVNKPIDPSRAVGGRSTPVILSNVPPEEPVATTAENLGNARTRSSAPTNSFVSAAPASNLAQTYSQAAGIAMPEGEIDKAWQWYTAAQILGGVADDRYSWYPALRRPCFGLHIGIGEIGPDTSNLRTVSSPASSARTIRRSGRGDQDRYRDQLLDHTAPFGKAFVVALQKHAIDHSIASALPGTGAEPRRRTSTSQTTDLPRMTFFEPAPAKQLRDEAEQDGCDVLVTFESTLNSSQTQRTVTFEVIDIGRGKSLYESRRLTFSRLQDDIKDLEDDPAFQKSRFDLSDLLEDGLSPHDWPVALNARLASQRVASLGKESSDFPLRQLAEMAHYRNLGLVDNQQLLTAIAELIGTDNAAALLLGNETKQERALRKWLPLDDAGELVTQAQAQATRAARDDD